jgi:late competence protein required for DNA uptake (superfamily II DNA/RNA helicase)
MAKERDKQMNDNEQCFICDTEDIHWECETGCGDYYCDDCAEENNYICKTCGAILRPID